MLKKALFTWKSHKGRYIDIDDLIAELSTLKYNSEITDRPCITYSNERIMMYNETINDIVYLLNSYRDDIPVHRCTDHAYETTMDAGDVTVVFQRCRLCGAVMSERLVKK